MLVLGIDDAGRGPIIGPLILAGVLVKKEDEPKLKKAGVADSKLLFHSKRIELSKLINNIAINTHIVKSTPEEIDNSITSGTNLNTLEAIKTAEIINKINTGKVSKEKIKVIVDCPSVNRSAWRNTLIKYITKRDNLDIYCEHKADFNHPSVSAASILAKVMREEEVSKLKKEYEKYGNLGSGYPSDPFTQAFIKKNGKALKDSGIFRKSWATWKALFPDKKQATLGDF